MANKYRNGKIYKIVDLGHNKCYIGSTIQMLCDRMNGHRVTHRKGDKKYKTTVSNLFDEYGIDNCKILLIESYPCNSKEELLAREGYYIQSTECVNKCVPGRTTEELKIRDYNKLKKWREENPEKHKAQIDKGCSIITCECGSEIQERIKNKHFKTRKHQEFISKNISLSNEQR